MSPTSSKTEIYLKFLSHLRVFFIAFILLTIVLRIAQVYDMERRGKLEREYFNAMRENDSERAIHYAKMLVKRKERNWIHGLEGACPSASLYLGYALEASGELDSAVKEYEEDNRLSKLTNARIAYKKGDFSKAFIDYCAAVDQRHFKDDNLKESVNSFEDFKTTLLFERSSSLKGLSPFANFSEFLRFMEEECAKLDNPQEYAPTITLLYRLRLESEKGSQEKNRESKSTVESVRPARQVVCVQLITSV
jgi:hypothetical protein